MPPVRTRSLVKMFSRLEDLEMRFVENPRQNCHNRCIVNGPDAATANLTEGPTGLIG